MVVGERRWAFRGLCDGELQWHTDMSSYEAPPNQTPGGTRLKFARRRQDRLRNRNTGVPRRSRRLRDRVERLRVEARCDDRRGYAAEKFRGQPSVDVRTSPGAVHPLVRTSGDRPRLSFLRPPRNVLSDRVSRSTNPKRCSTRYGRMPRNLTSRGFMIGSRATC